ncbi:MAG: DNA recombination protein RmuC [Bacilli bacterium]|nr:DNA recombination protein RmuC [Bacilli bacterium]
MSEYIIIGLLVVIIILIIILLFKGNSSLIERIGRVETNTVKELADFRTDLSKSINEDFDKLEDKVDKRLIYINDTVNSRLDDNFNKTNKTFNNVLERLSKIDEAQKKIDNLSGDIVSLQSILTDKKSRGIFGEVNLKHILASVFGEKNDKIYHLQYTLPNTTIADAVIFTPEPLGTVCIDSKFPLENYRLMVDKNLSQNERSLYEKSFKADVKKHIDAISSKYIIPGVTSNQAIMFLPAEAIFAEINAYHNDLVEYAYKRNVWITSPTTLISSLTTIQVLLKNMERDKYAKVVHDELTKLGVEFSRYKDRWDKLSRSIETVNKDVEALNITSDKITKKFVSISDVKLDDTKYLE